MIIDRRGSRVQNKEELDPAILDRWKFDLDDDDTDDIVEVDPFSVHSMRYRAAIGGSTGPHPQAQISKRAQTEASTSNSQSGAGPSTTNVPKEAAVNA